MIRIKDIYKFLDEIAPFKSAMDFDNCGVLIGNLDLEVKKVLLSLDITSDVCEEAKKLGANLIISHHPIIFKPVKNINFNTPLSKMLEYNISAICAHTNLDIAEKGVNFQLAKVLNLSFLKPLSGENGYSLGLIGLLDKEMNCEDFAKYVKEKLSCKGLRYTNSKKTVKKVAVCSGSGGNLIKEVIAKQVDAFVTGEIKHSDILNANENNISIVETGHFKSENVIINPLKNMLLEHLPHISVEISKVFTDKINYI